MWPQASSPARRPTRSFTALEQESRQREKLWFAGLFSGAGLLLILLI